MLLIQHMGRVQEREAESLKNGRLEEAHGTHELLQTVKQSNKLTLLRTK